MHRPELSVLYADEALLVLDKPAGLLSVPGRGKDKQDCLSARALRAYPDALIVHRLDMATSGVMVFARGIQVQRRLNEAFASRAVSKRYIAVVDGLLTPPAADWGVIDLPIGVDWPNRPLRVIDPEHGKPSVTRWRVLSQNLAEQTTRVELEPITGRSHQLRVHLLALGHAIVGDALYASPRVLAMNERLLLHACTLAFAHPVSGQVLQFDSPLPF
ncbi:MAG: RluA family pseudouridine synthase [Rhodoferax sp.]|uniref:RluA family pseudouridine synthase n=1 Tax=Rhodoferax sp. TaxID=50421 RepID=UPI00301670E6